MKKERTGSPLIAFSARNFTPAAFLCLTLLTGHVWAQTDAASPGSDPSIEAVSGPDQTTGTPPDQNPPGKGKLEKPKKEKPTRGVAIISGSVFREPGFAFGGAEVILEPKPEGKTSVKVKKMKTVSDSRGEFGFRVPAAPMRYTVSVQAAGYQTEKSEVSIQGEERQDVFVTLKAVAREAAPRE